MLKKRFAVSLCVFVVWAASAQALDLMGPPTSGLDFGKWGAGAAFYASEEDFDLDEGTLSDFESCRYYGWVGYGLSDWWEIYTRLGAIDAEADDLGFQPSPDFIGSLGTKVTFSRGDVVDWGFLLQWTWTQLDDSYSDTIDLSDFGLGTETLIFDVDMDYREFHAAVGPVIKLDGMKIYGGPFFHCVDGEVEIGVAGGEADFDLEEDSMFGGFAGMIIDLGSSAALNVEGALTGDAWGAGVNIGWEF